MSALESFVGWRVKNRCDDVRWDKGRDAWLRVEKLPKPRATNAPTSNDQGSVPARLTARVAFRI